MAEEVSNRPKDKPTPMHLRRQATDIEKVQSRHVEALAETKRRNSAGSRLLSQVRCLNCGILGHYGADCSEPRKLHSDRLTTLHAEKPYSAPELLQPAASTSDDVKAVNEAIKAHIRHTKAGGSDLDDDVMDTKSIYHSARTAAAAHAAAQDELEDQDIQQIKSLLHSI
jgi:hypothetical protein